MVLKFKKANCKNCYKCLRECPVKSIRVINHQAQIIEDKCILCGHCTKICPQDAKTVQNNLAEAQALIRGKRRIAVSLAPSYTAAFPEASASQIVNALYALGFDRVEETAIGAKHVSAQYNELLKSGVDNLITSACPSVVRLIRQYHPDALAYLAPVDSPMIAHAKLIRQRFPEESVVFIGPCISKKREAEESGLIDVALTFEELADWLKAEKIDPATQPKDPVRETAFCRNTSLYYPVNRGIVKSMGAYRDGYDYLCVDGVEKCREVLENIHSLHGFFIEMSACENSCVNGPCMTVSPGGFIKATETVRRFARTHANPAERTEETGLSFTAAYTPIDNDVRMPSEAVLKEILASVGKHSEADLLNCGACGYATCIDNAVAVYNQNAEPGMCVPYMRERAERIAEKIIDHSPNGIIAVDEELRIAEINNRAIELLGLPSTVQQGAQLSDYLNPTEYLLCASGTGQTSYRLHVDKTNREVDLTLSKIPKTNMLFGIYTDVTTQSRQREQLNDARKKTVATADEVIEKQMRVVQEIASLLGETTAETQVALSRLKDVIDEEP